MNRHLREFRFNYDDFEDNEPVPDEDGISAFSTMLAYNKTLSFFEVALEERLHVMYSDRFTALDGAIEVPAIPVASKMAFLAVVTNPEVGFEDSIRSIRKKRRRAKSYVIPSDSRSEIVKRIWKFISPVDSFTRTVSATLIQLDPVADDS